MKHLALKFFLLFLLWLPTSGFAQVTWSGDFENGDFSEFDFLLNPAVNGVPYSTVVQDIVSKGNNAGRIELHDDAKWSNGLRRVELQHSPENTRTAEGETIFFAWSIYIPVDFPTAPSQQIGYWESKSSFRQMMAFGVEGRNLSFATRQPQNKVHWTGEGVLLPGMWHRIGMRVKWSKDPAIGEVDVWFDNVKVVDKGNAKTLNDDNPHFVQFGILRGDADFNDLPVIYIDDAVEGLSLADIRIDALERSTMDEENMSDMGQEMDAADTPAQDLGSKDMQTMDRSHTGDVGSKDGGPDARKDLSTEKGKPSIKGSGSCSTTSSPFSFLFLFFLGFLGRRRK